MTRLSPAALLCALTLLLSSVASHGANDLPIWMTSSLTGEGITASSEGETEEEALINALWQLTQNIQTTISAAKKTYGEKQTASTQEAASVEVTKMIAKDSFGPSLTVKGMDKLEQTNKKFSSTFNVSFSQDEKYRSYKYFTEASGDFSDASKSLAVQSKGLSFNNLKSYLKNNGFSILSHQGMVKNEALVFVWLDYSFKEILKN